MNTITQYTILKKLAAIQDLDYEYEIDEDGCGVASIEGHRVEFHVNKYGDIDLWSAVITKEQK